MNSTRAPKSARRSLSNSASEGFSAGTPQLSREALKPDELTHPLVRRELQILPDQGAVNVLLVGLDDGIGLEWRRPLDGREVPLPHGFSLPRQSRARRATSSSTSSGSW